MLFIIIFILIIISVLWAVWSFRRQGRSEDLTEFRDELKKSRVIFQKDPQKE